MIKYEIETEYKKILPNSPRTWWHWKVYKLGHGQRKLIGSDSCIALTRWGANREAKKFIKGLHSTKDSSRKSIYYEVKGE